MTGVRHWKAGRARPARRAARVAVCGVGWGVVVCLVGLGAFELAVLWRAYPVARLEAQHVESLVVTDRRGHPIWESRRAANEVSRWTPLPDVAETAVLATLAAEDHRFYAHNGVDAFAVLRALWLNLTAQGQRYGASTLSMQLVRLAEPSDSTRTWLGKLVQALRARRLERALDKQSIVEQYLNRAYYGNGAVGIGAAARLYFGVEPAALSPAQGAFLAALPRAPTDYDPYRHKQRATRRMRHILARMSKLRWLDANAYRLALDAPLPIRKIRDGTHARHFLDYLLSAQEGLATASGTLHTTLDLTLQERLEVAVERHLDGVGSLQVDQAGIVVIENVSGDILAMLGSRDYDERSAQGAVNVTTVPRRAGSTLKPFVYGLAMESGDSPATLAFDVVLPGEANEGFASNVRQHGLARYREALAGSYNLAAVHTLRKVGADRLAQRLSQAGLTTLSTQPGAYDLDLAIGDAEIRLLEYAGAFAAFGNRGVAVTPRAVLARGGQAEAQAEVFSGQRVFSPQVAYLIFDILADSDARRPMFGSTAPMEVGFPVALKTGTTRGYTDNLAFGTTREFTVGAWAGNFDGTPMQAVMAMQGAAPLVRAAFVALEALYGTPTRPSRPSGLIRRAVCPLSGQRHGPSCPGRKPEWFTQRSAAAFDASPTCSFHTHGEGPYLVSFPPELWSWAERHGLPKRRIRAEGSQALTIAYPSPGSTFHLDPNRPPAQQRPPFDVRPWADEILVDGVSHRAFTPTPGSHSVVARRGRQQTQVDIVFER